MGGKEALGQESKATPPKVPGAELVRLYQSGLTLRQTAAATGLGRFAVAYRLKKAGVERRNPGSPPKTDAEKSAFAQEQLEALLGEQLPQVISDLQAGAVSAKDLAHQKGVKDSTFRTWLARAGVEVPNKGGKHRRRNNPSPRAITIFDLVDADGGEIVAQILEIFSQYRLDPQKVAAATDRHLAILGFTKEQIAYMQGQLEKNREIGP